MLIDQPGNQRTLPKKEGANHQNFRSISAPRGRITEENLASGRQPALADAPALHLPPVEHRPSKLDGRYFDVARFFSSEDANGNSGCLPAGVGHQEKRPAYNFATEEGFVIRKNRGVSDLMKPCQRRSTFVYNARRIDDH